MIDRSVQSLRNVLRPLYYTLRTPLQWLVLTGGIPILRRLPPQYRISQPALILLRFGWGNPWAASIDYLRAMTSTVSRTSGSVLECGSGATTLILTLALADSSRQIYTLEQDSFWYCKIVRLVNKHSLPNIHVQLVPIEDYGEFHWYDLKGVALPDDIGMVVCDGPPGSTIVGGRYGLLPVLSPKMKPKCIILVDDAEAERVNDVLNRWKREFNLHVMVRNEYHNPFAICSMADVEGISGRTCTSQFSQS